MYSLIKGFWKLWVSQVTAKCLARSLRCGQHGPRGPGGGERYPVQRGVRRISFPSRLQVLDENSGLLCKDSIHAPVSSSCFPCLTAEAAEVLLWLFFMISHVALAFPAALPPAPRPSNDQASSPILRLHWARTWRAFCWMMHRQPCSLVLVFI